MFFTYFPVAIAGFFFALAFTGCKALFESAQRKIGPTLPFPPKEIEEEKQREIEGVIAVQVQAKADAIYASTFYNGNENWFEMSLAVLGFKEIEIKDRTDISLDKLAQYHEQISAKPSS